jgi:hypothetical protein
MALDPDGTNWIVDAWNWLVGMLTLGEMYKAASPQVSGSNQFAGGISSTINGMTSIYTGVTMFAYGPVGWAIGLVGIVAGVSTILFGTAEIQESITGHNWIKETTGMSDGLYTGLYIGANITATVATIVGSYYKIVCNTTKLYRAVSPDEANSIVKSGNFSTKLGQAEGKYFATTKVNATQWGTKFYGKSFSVVGTRVSSAGLSNALSNGSAYFFNYALDGIGNAYFIDTAVINAILRSLWFY